MYAASENDHGIANIRICSVSAARSTPSMRSSSRYGSSPTSPMSLTCTMLLWFSIIATLASRSSASRCAGSSVNMSRGNLIAQTFSAPAMPGLWASHTCAMPPLPSGWMSWYLPNCSIVEGVRGVGWKARAGGRQRQKRPASVSPAPRGSMLGAAASLRAFLARVRSTASSATPVPTSATPTPIIAKPAGL